MQYIGSIIGDYCGSIYEWNNFKGEFPGNVEILKTGKFTDDSVLTIAVMDWLNKTKGESQDELVKIIKKWARKYPNVGYGGRFHKWVFGDSTKPINSFGNGSAMRVAPCAYFANTVEECLTLAKKSAEVTHNHEEGIKGAQAIAEAIYLARCGAEKDDIKMVIQNEYGYNLNLTLDDIGTKAHSFDATCQLTVPEAIICFVSSNGFLDCIQKSIYIGGDSDTIAAISAGIAEAYYGIPSFVEEMIKEKLPSDFKEVIIEFNKTMLER